VRNRPNQKCYTKLARKLHPRNLQAKNTAQFDGFSYYRSVMKTKIFVSFALCLLVSVAVVAQEAPPTTEDPPPPVKKPRPKIEKPWFVGGAVGLAFGSEVNYIEFSPLFGYQILPKFQLGGSLTFRYRKDKRFDPDLTTTDQGASVLGRFFVFGPIFLQAEVERLNWEYIGTADDGETFTTVESTYTGLYAGAGFVLAQTPKSAMYMTFLYDFNYEDGVPNPNSDPFLIRIGYGFRF